MICELRFHYEVPRLLQARIRQPWALGQARNESPFCASQAWPLEYDPEVVEARRLAQDEKIYRGCTMISPSLP